ncbi:MAG: WG repeat-containing protein [Paludibacteraceae bacterium]|nr:WG repeat-containing protein [Paludibacteraceae bacterium]
MSIKISYNRLIIICLMFFSCVQLFSQEERKIYKQMIVPFYDLILQKYGYRDSLLNMVAIPAEYESAFAYREDRALVKKNGLFGYLNKAGKIQIPLIYQEARSFANGLAAVKLEKWGYIDVDGNTVIAMLFDEAKSFQKTEKGLVAFVLSDGKWGLVDSLGTFPIGFPFEYDEYQSPSIAEDLICAKKNGVWGYFSLSGKEQIKCAYDVALPFQENIAAVQKDGKWGFINKKGKIIIPMLYGIGENEFPIFHDELLLVTRNGKYGFIDKNGKIVVPFVYDYAENFNKGKAFVRVGNESLFIDTTGKEILF